MNVRVFVCLCVIVCMYLCERVFVYVQASVCMCAPAGFWWRASRAPDGVKVRVYLCLCLRFCVCARVCKCSLTGCW